MGAVDYLVDFLLFALIVVAPIPLCISLLFHDRKCGGPGDLSHRLLMITAFWCVLQLLIASSLTIIRQLNHQSAACVHSALFLAGLYLLYNATRRRSATTMIREMCSSGRTYARPERVLLTVGALLAAMLLWTVTTWPTTNFDSLWYHLPVIAGTYQQGSYEVMEHLGAVSRYTFTWHMLAVLLIQPFGEDFLVCLPNFVAWLMVGLGIYRVCVILGSVRQHAMAAALLFLSMPLVLDRVNTAQVDLALAAFFVFGAYLLLTLLQAPSVWRLALFVATVAVLPGIKVSGIIYSGLLMGAGLLTVALLAVRGTLRRRTPLSLFGFAAGLLVFGCGCLLILSGHWYIRNYLDVGNPLGHVEVKVFETVVFPGTKTTDELHKTTLAGLFHLFDLGHWRILFVELARRLGAPFGVLGLLLFVLPIAMSRFRKTISLARCAGPALVAAVTGVLYWYSPYSGDNGSHGYAITPWIGNNFRYAFPFLCALSVTAGIVVGLIRIPTLVVLVATVAAVVQGVFASTAMANGPRLSSVMGMLVLYPVIFLAARVFTRSSKAAVNARQRAVLSRSIRLAGVAIAVALAVGMAARRIRSQQRREVYGEAYTYISDELDQNDVVAHLLTRRSFLFYGENLDRTVVPVPSGFKHRAEWVKWMERNQVTVVALGPVREKWRERAELEWLDVNDETFVRMTAANLYEEPVLYRLYNGRDSKPPIKSE